jgi:hypothetical protein
MYDEAGIYGQGSASNSLPERIPAARIVNAIVGILAY